MFSLLRFYEELHISIRNHYRMAALILKLQRSNMIINQIIKLISRNNNYFFSCHLKNYKKGGKKGNIVLKCEAEKT